MVPADNSFDTLRVPHVETVMLFQFKTSSLLFLQLRVVSVNTFRVGVASIALEIFADVGSLLDGFVYLENTIVFTRLF